MPRRTYEPVQEETYSPYSSPRFPIEYKLVVYARQSQKDAPIKHKESYELQTVRLIECAKELGWKDEDIIIFIENKRKDGKWRKASGTLRIDQREGLQSTVGLIEADEVKAVMVWAVDRLFRHEDMVEPAVFVRICEQHHTKILTPDDFFDFNILKRGDRRRFLELAQQAADYITKHIKGRMIPAMYQVARRGEYDGRCIPIGLILFEGEKKPHGFEPQAEVIKNRLFKRFKELDGRFNLLWREIAPIRDLFPPYPKDAGVVGVKSYMFEGPFGITRDGLIGILTNPAYIGVWYFKENGKNAIRIPNNHPAIVDEEDFWFAFNHLSKTTITGVPNEQRSIRPPARFDRVGVIPAESLLDGIVTCPQEKYHVYVLQKADKPGNAAYAVQGPGYSSIGQDNDAYILVRELDRIFEQRLKYRLRLFQAMDDVREISGSGKSAETSMYEYLKSVQAMANQELIGVDSQISEYRQEIANIERTLELFAHKYDNDSIIKMGERLAKLNVTLKELEKKQARRIEEEDLKESASLLTEASVSYDDMLFEKKQKLVRLVTTKLQLSILAPRWLNLQIAWSPFMGVSVEDLAFIWHPNGSGGKWSDEEIKVLTSMYQTEEKDSIRQALPGRSWIAIKNKAFEIGVKRLRWLKNSTLPDILSLEDDRIMQENDLDYTDPSRRVWWKSIPVLKDDAYPGTCIQKQAPKIIIVSRKISF